MKKTAMLAAAAALLAASPAAANGYVGLEYGSGSIDSGGPDLDFDAWQGEGAFGWGGAGWGGQIDGSFGTVDASGADIDAYTLGGHLWWAGSNWRLGGVVTTTSADAGGSSDVDEWSYGGEGTYDFTPNAQLVSSLTVGTADSGGSDIDTFNWDAGVNFYANPNFRIGGFFGIGSLDGGVIDVDTSSFGVNAEFQPWSAPVSFTIGWNSFQIDDLDADSDVLQVGARWNFGGGTVQERNNHTPYDTNTGFVNCLYGIW